SGDDAHLLAKVVTGEDAEPTKPSPEIIQATLDKVGSARGLVVGDAVWDVVSAERAGLGRVGVRTAGVCDIELRQAGAIEVYEGPGELADHLTEVVGPQRCRAATARGSTTSSPIRTEPTTTPATAACVRSSTMSTTRNEMPARSAAIS